MSLVSPALVSQKKSQFALLWVCVGQILSALPVYAGASIGCRAAVSGLKLLLSSPVLCSWVCTLCFATCSVVLWHSSKLPASWETDCAGFGAHCSALLIFTENHNSFSWKGHASKLNTDRYAAVGLFYPCHSGTSNITNEICPFFHLLKNILVCYGLVVWLRIHLSLQLIYMPALRRLLFYWDLCAMLQC